MRESIEEKKVQKGEGKQQEKDGSIGSQSLLRERARREEIDYWREYKRERAKIRYDEELMPGENKQSAVYFKAPHHGYLKIEFRMYYTLILAVHFQLRSLNCCKNGLMSGRDLKFVKRPWRQCQRHQRCLWKK